jgi:DNA (cytosine-5)-methyltransferase 1
MSNPRGGAARMGYAGMNYLSVCSGIEAATVAWHSLGWTDVVWAEVLKRNRRSA